MEISFENKKLRQLCENQNRAKTQLGTSLALRLKTFLADLDIFNNVNELISGRIYKTRFENNTFVIELSGELEIVFSVNHLNPLLSVDNTINWSKVTRIKIINIQGKQ